MLSKARSLSTLALILLLALAQPSMPIHVDSSLPPSTDPTPNLSHGSLSKLSDPLLALYRPDDVVPSSKRSGPWGLAIYRTYWSHTPSSSSPSSPSASEISARYTTAKTALIRASERAASSGAIAEVAPRAPWRVDPEMLLLRFVDDASLRERLDGAEAAELRTIFNPGFGAESGFGGGGGNWLGLEGGIHEAAFLILDEEAVEAILRAEDREEGGGGGAGSGDGGEGGGGDGDDAWVLAVDAMADRSQVFRVVDGEVVYVDYDGTMRVHLDFVFTEFYWRLLEASEMSRAHGKPGEVYKGWRPDVEAMRRRHPELAEMERESELWRQQQAVENSKPSAKDEL